jgi:hypothetical protein
MAGHLSEGKRLDDFLAEIRKRDLDMLGDLLADRTGEAAINEMLEAVRLEDMALMQSLIDLVESVLPPVISVDDLSLIGKSSRHHRSTRQK